MSYDPEKHRRKSIRLKGFDYSRPGTYFVTICTRNRTCLFGDVLGNKMVLNDAEKMIQNVWIELSNHYHHVCLDEMVIMPNHIHGIIVLSDGFVCNKSFVPIDAGAGFKPAPTRHGLPEIVRGFKTFSARRINKFRQTVGHRVWQRNYHDHIIRNEEDLNRVPEYIRQNPAMWNSDRNHPDRGHG